ncbi:hypothetical protein PbB2_01947 [Candidatus Phycosocius bacilliformis]|uniref:Uncharacterized protein n=1 Tax=Candidatus Phycosocius bacilliformis TaxID=1445552 RepID=A0A2P2EB46_9PROT|nr:hypothetical protein PbB2_01947 [Candidatus Phycosocius bacilliformis]
MSNHSLAFMSDAGKLGKTAHSGPPFSSCSGNSNPAILALGRVKRQLKHIERALLAT